MRKLRLSTFLIMFNAGLLLAAVAGVAYVAAGLLGQLADEQALERVGHATLIAGQVMQRSGEEALVTAQLLAERPTLARLVADTDQPGLQAFLAQFQATAAVDGIAVFRDGALLAQSGPAIPWTALWEARNSADRRFLRDQAAGAPLLLGAWAPVSAQGHSGVVVVHQVDAAFVRELATEIGLDVAVSDRQAVLGGAPDTRAALRRQVLTSRIPAARRMDSTGLYVAARPLVAPSGETVGVVETALPTAGITHSIQQLTGTLALLALAVAMVAAVLNLAIGRELTRPLAALTAAAARIGRGDLSTPVPHTFPAEVGVLANTLEDMRRHLMQLAADLQRQEAEAQAIVSGVVEGVFSVDRNRRIRYLNPQGARLLGTTVEEATGRFCGDVLRPRGNGLVRPCEQQCPILHARFRGGARATEQLQVHDGTTRIVVITSAPPAQDRQVQILRDETEQEATRRLRDAVLDNITHEFRTPLSAQLASIELLQDQLPDLTIEQIGQLIASLQRGTLRLAQLVDNLLESARIEAQRDTLRRMPVALDEVIEEAVALTQPLMHIRQQVIEVNLPYPLPPIEGDAPRLVQVFVNLLANANKFAPAGSTIRVRGDAGVHALTIHVEDEGPGLPEAAVPELFTRFVRSADEEPDQSGAGLGLWIVKSIIERHGGKVEASNSGQGARMTVTLPVRLPPSPSDRQAEVAKTAPATQPPGTEP